MSDVLEVAGTSDDRVQLPLRLAAVGKEVAKLHALLDGEFDKVGEYSEVRRNDINIELDIY